MQDLATFRLPPDFRGRSGWVVQLWWLIQSSLFRWSPQFAYSFRSALLRLFGAEIGTGTVIRPTVTVTYPWKVKICDHAWIGDDVVLYSLGDIQIGANSVISQRSYLCAADHDYTRTDFPIRARPINVGDQVWVAANVFIGPGVKIGDCAVIGASSTVLSDMPAAMVCVGYPCKPIKKRRHL